MIMPPYSLLDSNDLNQNTVFLVWQKSYLKCQFTVCIVTMANTDYQEQKKFYTNYKSILTIKSMKFVECS